MTTQPVNATTTLEPRARKILLAAAELFISKGFHQTSTRDIARAAGVSLGNLYTYFPGKLDLIHSIAVLEAEELAPLLAQLNEPGDAKTLLVTFVRDYFEWAAKPENVILDAEITAETYRNPAAATAFLQNRAALENALTKLLGRLNNARGKAVKARAALLLDLLNSSASRACFATKREAKVIRETLHDATAALFLNRG